MIQMFNDFDLPALAMVVQDDEGNIALVTNPALYASMPAGERCHALNLMLSRLPDMTPVAAAGLRTHLRAV